MRNAFKVGLLLGLIYTIIRNPGGMACGLLLLLGGGALLVLFLAVTIYTVPWIGVFWLLLVVGILALKHWTRSTP